MSDSQRLEVEQLIKSGPDLASLPPVELRVAYDAIGDVTTPDPAIAYRKLSAGGVPVEIGCAPGSDSGRTILYFHGGGYVIGSLTSHRGLVGLLGAAAGARTVAVDYRLAPEHPYPAASDDAIATYRWLLDTDTAASSIAFAGDSAGAGLALATMLRARDEGLPLPVAAVLLSPFLDLSCTGDSLREKAADDVLVSDAVVHGMAEAYLGGTDPRTPYASPLFGDLGGMPPIMMHVGSSEVLLDDSIRLLRALGIANVAASLRIWVRLPHVWQLYSAILEEGPQSLAESGAFLKTYLNPEK